MIQGVAFDPVNTRGVKLGVNSGKSSYLHALVRKGKALGFLSFVDENKYILSILFR